MKTNLKLHCCEAGYCTHPECTIIYGGKIKQRRFPGSFFVIEHPSRGIILFDTGYSDEFEKGTSSFPYSLYRKATPVSFDGESAAKKIRHFGLEAKDVNYIIISHFHADHVAGIKEFPEAKFIYLKECFDEVKDLTGIKALLNGFLPNMIPHDIENRSMYVNDLSKASSVVLKKYFDEAWDIFGDDSVFAVPLDGHVRGQIGIFIWVNNRPIILAADATWCYESLVLNTGPHFVASFLFHSWRNYHETLSKLSEMYHDGICVVPSHCEHSLEELKKII